MKLLIAVLPSIAVRVAAADTPVVVNNSVKNAVPVLVQAPQETFTFGSGLIEYNLFIFPVGKKLVIETIPVRTSGPGFFDLKLRYNAPQVNAFVIPMALWPSQSSLPSEGLVMSGLHDVKMYVAANQTVRLQMVGGFPLPAPNANSPKFIDFAISGHLVDEI